MSLSEVRPTLLTYLNIREIAPLHRRNAPPLIKFTLPHPAQIRQQIPHTLPRLRIPHLQRALGPADNFIPVMGKARNGARMRAQIVQTLSRLRIPDAQRRVRRRRHEGVVP